MLYRLHRQPCYASLRYKDDAFPRSVACFEQGICLPTWVGLAQEQVRYFSETLKEALVQVR